MIDHGCALLVSQDDQLSNVGAAILNRLFLVITLDIDIEVRVLILQIKLRVASNVESEGLQLNAQRTKDLRDRVTEEPNLVLIDLLLIYVVSTVLGRSLKASLRRLKPLDASLFSN